MPRHLLNHERMGVIESELTVVEHAVEWVRFFEIEARESQWCETMHAVYGLLAEEACNTVRRVDWGYHWEAFLRNMCSRKEYAVRPKHRVAFRAENQGQQRDRIVGARANAMRRQIRIPVEYLRRAPSGRLDRMEVWCNASRSFCVEETCQAG